MNARVPVPAIPRLPRPSRSRSADREFLPAALEIVETPPSPVRLAILWTICLLAVGALVWSWFGRLDVVAVAQGKIQPAGRVKVIQSMEVGRVAAVLVENGQRVARGEPLVRLDSGETDADVAQLEADLGAFSAEAERRRTAIAAVEDRVIEPIPTIDWKRPIPPAIQARETQVLHGDLGKLTSTVAGLTAQWRQKQRERERFIGRLAALGDLVATLQSRVDMRATLRDSGSGSKADFIDALETLQEQKTALADDRGQVAESEAAIDVLSRQIEDAYRSFLADNLQKLAEAERQVDEDSQRLAKARLRQARTTLTSPIDGLVSALSITTVGQVVGAGEEVMRIVPAARDGSVGPSMEIEAYVANRDIGFVRPGQEAVVKVESLPFTRYGTVEATVLKVADDAIPEPDASRREGDPTQSISERGFAGAQRTQNLVFPATFRLGRTSMEADGASIALSPGMAVTVEVRTGSRRILEYLFSPLVEVGSEAMKER